MQTLLNPDHEQELSWVHVLRTCGVVSGDRLHHSGYQSHNEAQREAYDIGATALLARDGEEHTAKVRCSSSKAQSSLALAQNHFKSLVIDTLPCCCR